MRAPLSRADLVQSAVDLLRQAGAKEPPTKFECYFPEAVGLHERRGIDTWFIEYVYDLVQSTQRVTEEERAKVEKLATALRHLRAALYSTKSLEGRLVDIRAPENIAAADPGIQAEVAAMTPEVRAEYERLAAAEPLIETTLFQFFITKKMIDDQLALIKCLLPSTKDTKGRMAVGAAYFLLRRYGLQTLTTRARKVDYIHSRPRRDASLWLQLAAILAGEPDNPNKFYHAAAAYLNQAGEAEKL
jgi:hypothetical protein